MNRVKRCVFLVRKGSYTTFNIIKIRKIWVKKGKILKTRSMTKRIEIFTLKMKIFSEKTSFRNLGSRKKFSVPPKFGARSPPLATSSIFLQLLTPSTTTYYLKDCPPGSVLLTRLSSGFSPIFLLALSLSKHRKHHPNHALSPVVFRKVQFSGP